MPTSSVHLAHGCQKRMSGVLLVESDVLVQPVVRYAFFIKF